ncbi:TetR family transcriptional regulator [Zavarzinia compransoris]|uniref:TetR family transcriptional regulator n=1 Tax=Zavarzinia compransoris TaxID=1264899 RepID=A0A317E4U0_9PROT|nr:TetR family transcriptional regulator [Zavarzinia compransoris]PWR20015.1 TetR family transcriptional regulator [Zavarzinia compransoris]TDP44865.1 TetR family transcriptional regulator [Zavarzinia compransoris]
MAPTGDTDTDTRTAAVIAAALALAAEQPWSGVGLAAIAARAGLPLVDLYPDLQSKTAILRAFARRIDRLVLAGEDESLLREPPRDRLFDVLMRRFEALAPWRAGLRSIVAAERRDPLEALRRVPDFLASMRWMTAAAGLDGDGIAGFIHRRGAEAVFLAVLPVFLADESEDLARTMAALDRQLTRGDRILRRLPMRLFRGGSVVDAP